MSTAQTPFKEIHSIKDSLMVSLDCAANVPMKFDSRENWVLMGHMNATQWILIELAQAMIEEKLGERLLELMQELDIVRTQLRGDGYVEQWH